MSSQEIGIKTKMKVEKNFNVMHHRNLCVSQDLLITETLLKQLIISESYYKNTRINRSETKENQYYEASK